jgi:hypothetical protein
MPMLPYLSPRQSSFLETAITREDWYVEEPLWSFLVAALVAEAPDRYIPLFCGRSLRLPPGGRVVCEAEPIGPRVGAREGNTVLDIAFGHVGGRALPSVSNAERRNLLAGITYAPRSADAWVCFVEAKYLSDCSTRTRHDPCRNQLTRVIENLLCFQGDGEMPSRLHFALLTPALFKKRSKSRLYGYKMADYVERRAILEDISNCEFAPRTAAGFTYPDLSARISTLAPPQWVTFEEVLEVAGFGAELDIVNKRQNLGDIKQEIETRLVKQRQSDAS